MNWRMPMAQLVLIVIAPFAMVAFFGTSLVEWLFGEVP
jgi:hypothetical protein